MSAITNELVTNFTFGGSIQPLTQYNASFSNAISLMSKGVGIISAVNTALMGFAASQFTAIDQMGQLSRETGTSIEALQEWGYVASVNGGTVEGLQDSIRGLNERIGEYVSQDSGEGKAIFEKLGISVKNASGEVKNAEDVMLDLRDRFKDISKAEQISIAQKLGINKGMLQTLNLTNEQFDETRNKIRAIGTVSKEDADKVIAFNDAMTTTKMGLNAVGNQVALGMLPNMMNLVDAFNDLLFSNADLITNGLSKTISVLSAVISAVANVGKAIYYGIDYFIGFENALMLAGAAMLYLNRAMLLNPIGLIAAAIAGLVLIVDDLYVAFTGGKSVIQDFFASFNVDIVNVLKTAFDGLKFTLNSVLGFMLRVSESFTSLILLTAQAGNFLGMDIDTKGIEEFKKLQEQTRVNLSAENQKIANDVASRNYTTSQQVTINQNITGQDANRIAELSGSSTKDALNGANAQIPNGGR